MVRKGVDLKNRNKMNRTITDSKVASPKELQPGRVRSKSRSARKILITVATEEGLNETGNGDHPSK
jgi:hypothetical protein